MQHPLEFYIAEKERFEQEHKTLKKQLALSSTLRLLVFLMAVAGIYFFFGDAKGMIYVVVSAAILFIYLLNKHAKLQYKSDLNKALVEINNTEIKVLNRDYFSLNSGTEFINPAHPFSYDIDLFGKGSFFQYANRTVTNEGRQEFVDLLTNNDILNITNKQQSIKELSEKPTWRQQFSALASLVKVEHPAKEIVNWIHNYKSVFPKFLSFLPTLFSIISLVLIVLIAMQMIPDQILLIWIFVGLGISGA